MWFLYYQFQLEYIILYISCTSDILSILFHSGNEWSPRIDIAESGRNYVMMVEIPGINTNDIRVEVDDQK